MDRAELIRNMEATAEKLTGRPVTILVRDYGANGGVTKNLTGACIVDLSPVCFEDPELFTRIFTHEAAHVVKHFDALPRVDINRDVSAEVSAQKIRLALKSPAATEREDEAEALARKWRDRVNELYSSHLGANGYDPYLCILRILYHHTGDIRP